MTNDLTAAGDFFFFFTAPVKSSDSYVGTANDSVS